MFKTFTAKGVESGIAWHGSFDGAVGGGAMQQTLYTEMRVETHI